MKSILPKVSVVMPVYNREKYVAEAVASIINQTFTDLEFIIIDDGSTDSTFEILKTFNDNRIKLIRKSDNKGNYSARNEGMELASGKYICVIDSDDIALPNRIQRQFEFMEANQKIGLCGSFVKVIDSDEIITAPENHEEIKVWSLSNIMFRHPTVFIRTEFLKKYKLKYNDSYRYAGDYDFLVKAAHLFPVTNIQEVLLEYRKHPEQISSANKSGQVKVVQQVILSQLNNFKRNITDEEKQLHLALMNRNRIQGKTDFNKLKVWANYLILLNNKTGIFDSLHLANFLKSLLKYIIKEYQISQLSYKNQQLYSTEINKFLNAEIYFPLQNPWVVLQDFIQHFIELVKENKPSTIVECGSGLTTLVGGYMVKNKIIKHFISIEHEEQFYEATLNDLKKHTLEKYVTLLYAPLKRISINGEEWFWYNTDRFETTINQIDILLVDGPPGQIQKHSRYPAFPLLKKFFHKNIVVVLDDSDRTDEKEIINRWLLENPGFCASHLKTEKGMCVLNKKI
jgi:glycosyltransferase involved in cell wall biosynthesis